MQDDVNQMDDDRFWALIGMLDWSKTGDDEAVIEPVVHALSSMTADEIVGFEAAMAHKLYELDRHDIAHEFGSGSLRDDYFSPDGFLYSRCVVVVNGQELHRAVLADPQEMPEDLEFEALLTIAAAAWERKTGEEGKFFDVPFDYETGSNEAGWSEGE